MTTDKRLSIGGFALVSGLSINALRHYDELGLLRPAFVDPATGYRRYEPGQVHRAWLIRALRRVDMPIDAVRQVVDDPDGVALTAQLRRHRNSWPTGPRSWTRWSAPWTTTSRTE